MSEILQIIQGNAAGLQTTTTEQLYFGNAFNRLYFLEGLIDNVILYNRILDSTEAKRHSERRYPAQ